jgi:hypothetical protein
MSNKNIRERKELENLFADPKYAKHAWKSVGQAILLNPVKEPIAVIDKDGKTKKYKFDNADDYLNIPPNLEDVFADCLVMRAIVTNNKDEQDENYRPSIQEFNEHWGVFKAMANPTKMAKRVVI